MVSDLTSVRVISGRSRPCLPGSIEPSRQITDDVRSDEICAPQRHATPQRRRACVLRIRLIELRNRTSGPQPIMPVELPRLGTPLSLEAICSTIHRRATEIESFAPRINPEPK